MHGNSDQLLPRVSVTLLQTVTSFRLFPPVSGFLIMFCCPVFELYPICLYSEMIKYNEYHGTDWEEIHPIHSGSNDKLNLNPTYYSPHSGSFFQSPEFSRWVISSLNDCVCYLIRMTPGFLSVNSYTKNNLGPPLYKAIPSCTSSSFLKMCPRHLASTMNPKP